MNTYMIRGQHRVEVHKMKAHTHIKAKGTTRVNNQQVVFKLKQRVVFALNKLADRDTHQLGVEELEKTIECLTPDGIAPFLSCILDTDSEQKSAVRKECIRMMGNLATFHEGLIGPHLGKMVASIVKRLKDPDSVVKDACVDTVGVLASKSSDSGDESDGVFVILVKPLFEALGEQNKQLQSGSALCLARIIDNTSDPPVSILQRMLTRTIKMLKNPHFMAKPAVIELNRSLIQAGGAPTQSALSAAMTSIQEALKNSDWTTRKAASASLAEIASGGGSFFGTFKTSCIQSLESCRFDKVKPVRDTVLQALHLWKRLPRSDPPEPSEAGSSIKENFCGGDYGNKSVASETEWKDVMLTKVGSSSITKNTHLSLRKASQSFVRNPPQSNANDWNIEIAVPKNHHASSLDVYNEESEGSSVTRTVEGLSTVITSPQDVGYEYVQMDDRNECSSVSNHVADNFETKFVTVSHDCVEEGALRKPIGINGRFAAERISPEEQRFQAKMEDRRSLDSTVTESSSLTMRGCCIQPANEMVSIRKHLLEIEDKQSSLMDQFKAFTTSTMDTLSTIQKKVSDFEHIIGRIAQDLVYRERLSDPSTDKLSRKSTIIVSPRLSTCTPRPSVDTHSRHPPLLSKKNAEVWEEKAFPRTRSSTSAKQAANIWTEPTVNLSRKPVEKGGHKGSGHETHRCSTSKSDSLFPLASKNGDRQTRSETRNSLWNLVKGYLLEGDLDSAYVEALCSDEELVLIELLERTGPVLDYLSHKTATDVLSTLASYFLEQRFISSIIPWLHQCELRVLYLVQEFSLLASYSYTGAKVVDLSTIQGSNCLALSSKVKQEFLSAIQEAANMEFSNPAERRSIAQLGTKLHQIWGKCS